MRLTTTQAQIIKDTVARVIGPSGRIWLFGSRADDTMRGGDIDLFVETDEIIPNRIKSLCKLEGSLVMAVGDRKLDILLKDGRTQEAHIFTVARREGVRL
jgi:predicted nucleotidyltransferase